MAENRKDKSEELVENLTSAKLQKEGRVLYEDEDGTVFEDGEFEEYDGDIILDAFESALQTDVEETPLTDALHATSRIPEEEIEEALEEDESEEEAEEEKLPPPPPVKKKKKRAPKGETIISLKNVTKSYVKGVPALNNVNIDIKKGEFVFIVGGSGSGKSTLIKLLLRELVPTSGSIMVNGFQLERMRRWNIPKLRRSLGVVFQDFRLLQDRDVYENVAFAQRIIQVSRRAMKRNVSAMLSLVGLASKYNAKPKELSGGEQQRVALARALVNKPPILLADEPTGNLDPKNTTEIMNLLEQINENGTTVIVVTHNDKIVNDMQKRVVTIKKGLIVSDEEKGGYIDED